jgi:hypothetical protein
MSFKIVDNFYGAHGGSLGFLGIGEEARDTRRFGSEAEARETIEMDRVDSETAQERRGVTKPLEDQWGRRYMNLEVVPSDFMWCHGLGDGRWLWQQPLEFKFRGPTSSEILSYTVFLNTRLLGRVETDSIESRHWRAKAQGFSKEEFLSAYQAACALLRHWDDSTE